MYSGGFPLPDIDLDDFSMVPIDESNPNSSPKTMKPNLRTFLEKFGFTPNSDEPIKATSNSAVYRAVSNYDNHEYALKISSNKNRLMKEYFNSEKLEKSDYIVKYYDIYEDGNFAMLQMEVCEGGDLFSSSFNEDLIWLLIHDVGWALYQIHKNGFMHLDVSPSNILRSDICFKLADYGTLLEEGDFNAGLEGAGPYTSPETLSFPNVDVNRQTDIFSFGIVLLEIASGYYAPRGGDKKYELLRKGEIKLGECGYVTDMSNELVSLVNTMLRPDPYERPTSLMLLNHPNSITADKNREAIIR